MDYKIAIVGPKSVVSGFKALGVDAFNADDGERAVVVIKELGARGKEGNTETPYAVVIVTEGLVAQIPEDDYARITKDTLPALVVLPGIEGSTGQSKQKLKELTERAVGSDILG